MIKAVFRQDDTQMTILGLTVENVTRLVAGETIRFDAAEIGWPEGGTFVLVYGTTDDTITHALKNRFAPRGQGDSNGGQS